MKWIGLWALGLALVISNSAKAHWSDCESALSAHTPMTLHKLRDLSARRAERRLGRTPRLRTEYIEQQADLEVASEPLPRALQEGLPDGVEALTAPVPTSPDPAAVSLIEQHQSVVQSVKVPFKGKMTKTAVYLTNAGPKSSDKKYLIGPEHSVAVMSLHGGGTPTATGKNGVSIGEKLNVPMLAPDLPGHGVSLRDPDSFTKMLDVAEYLLQLTEQTIHPDTKIVLVGHSYGAMITLFMQRLSAHPRYARFAHFVSIAPGIDVSLGGSVEDRLEFEQWFEKNYQKLQEKMAKADFDFKSNLLSNGKDSDVATVHTGLAMLDYATPVLSDEEMAKLKPLTVIVGEHDGIVYVGREKYFQKLFGNLKGPSQFIVLPPGLTWKSKSDKDLIRTGHNVFDRYIDGTTKLQVYSILSETANLYRAERTMPQVDEAEALVQAAENHALNFLAFREMADRQTEFVTSPTPMLFEVSKEKTNIDGYLGRVEDAESKHRVKAEADLKSVSDVLRKELGIAERMTPERATQELNLPELSGELKSQLETYFAEYDKLEGSFDKTFVDPQGEKELKDLTQKFDKILKEMGIAKLEDYDAIRKKLREKTDRDQKESKQLTNLDRLHQAMIQIQNGRRKRFGLALDEALKKIPLPEGARDIGFARMMLVSDRSPERRQILQTYLTEYPKRMAAQKLASAQELADLIDQLARPSGIDSVAAARARKIDLDARLGYTYIPTGPKSAVPASWAAEVIRLENEVENSARGEGNYRVGLEKHVAELHAAIERRAGVRKRWDALWVEGELSTPALERAQKEMEEKLARYWHQYHAYEDAKGLFLAQLNREGRLHREYILALTPEIKKLRSNYLDARRRYLKSRTHLDKLRGREIENAQRPPSNPLIVKAQMLWQDLSDPAFDQLAADVEAHRQSHDTLQYQLHVARLRYVSAMVEAGEPVPNLVKAYSIKALLELPREELLARMRSETSVMEAMRAFMTRWDRILAELRFEANRSAGDAGGY
ncbi:MAG: alpha/beta fold hydrolase [Bdellovibrionales bacterium]